MLVGRRRRQGDKCTNIQETGTPSVGSDAHSLCGRYHYRGRTPATLKALSSVDVPPGYQSGCEELWEPVLQTDSGPGRCLLLHREVDRVSNDMSTNHRVHITAGDHLIARGSNRAYSTATAIGFSRGSSRRERCRVHDIR